MTATIRLRRGTAAAWTSANPTLALGEPGMETDTLKFKVGDGSTAWTSLAYFNPAGGGIGAVLFDSTLGSDTASIDTGAGGIAGGYKVLEIWLYARTDEAVVASPVGITLNNDTGTNYDSQRLSGINTTASAAGNAANNGWINNVAGNNCASNVFGLIKISLPNYTGTTGYKAGDMYGGFADTTAANDSMSLRLLSYRSTAAVTRLAAVPSTAGVKLKTGSRLTVFGR